MASERTRHTLTKVTLSISEKRGRENTVFNNMLYYLGQPVFIFTNASIGWLRIFAQNRNSKNNYFPGARVY